MPYGINSPSWDNDDHRPVRHAKKSTGKQSMAKRYNKSEQMAYDNGFRAVYDDNAYNGRYFVKNDKIWIHDLSALKHTLREYDENELRDRGYDVDTYHDLH